MFDIEDNRQNVEFKTHDGTILRGWFFPAGDNSPLIVMSPGLTGVKENFLGSFARRFQSAGYACLVYDQRNWGDSEGTPRHHSNHYEQCQDSSDAISYASKLPGIDASRIAIWGSSFSGGIALVVGAVDPRVKVVVAQVPFISGPLTAAKLPPDALAKIYEDHYENGSDNATYVRVYPDCLEESLKPNDCVMGTEECWHFRLAQGEKVGAGKENNITMRSLFHMFRSEPRNFIPRIAPKPLLMIVAKQDSLINPQKQIEAFGVEDEHRKLFTIDCGHFGVYQGERFAQNIVHQLEFLKQNL